MKHEKREYKLKKSNWIKVYDNKKSSLIDQLFKLPNRYKINSVLKVLTGNDSIEDNNVFALAAAISVLRGLNHDN